MRKAVDKKDEVASRGLERMRRRLMGQDLRRLTVAVELRKKAELFLTQSVKKQVDK